MPLHHESAFETEICEHLGAHGWLYAKGDAAGYDRARALFPADVIAWVQASQPKAWNTLVKNRGAKAETYLLDRLRASLDAQGTLAVLRHPIVPKLRVGMPLVPLQRPVRDAERRQSRSQERGGSVAELLGDR